MRIGVVVEVGVVEGSVVVVADVAGDGVVRRVHGGGEGSVERVAGRREEDVAGVGGEERLRGVDGVGWEGWGKERRKAYEERRTWRRRRFPPRR